MANLKLTRSKLEQSSLKGLLCSWHAINIMLLTHACGFVKSELLTLSKRILRQQASYHLVMFLLWMRAVSCPKWHTLADCFQHTCTDLIRSARLISASFVSPKRWQCQS